MYVCICNALREREVGAAIRDGARTAGQVYLRLGCTPRCGKCVTVVREMVGKAPHPAAPASPALMAAE